MREISPMEILLDYNERKGRPVLREVLAREFLLDWVASNLLFIWKATKDKAALCLWKAQYAEDPIEKSS